MAADAAGGVALLGIRHHGPGSARAVVRALEELRPDAVLIEGPPEADVLVPLVAAEGMRPPVALLAYAANDPRRAAFWPFAVFSPEWQALRYAVSHQVPVRFFDLPIAHRFALDTQREEADRAEREEAERAEADAARQPDPTAPTDPDPSSGPAVDPDPSVSSDPAAGLGPAGGAAPEGTPLARADPIGALAEAAGYDDAERWWDDVVEHRRDGAPPFPELAEAMAAVREATGDYPGREEDERREAYMRSVLRQVRRAGHQRIAVVCGAWHVPALADPPPVSRDTALLKGLPKAKVATTWVPWTHGRLASWRGYGAGVSSPGWYHHLFSTADRVVPRWLVRVARVLRDEDLPVSSAHVIEAVRLAEALAVLRGRPLAGLAEVTEATRAVLCDGDEARLSLVQRRLVVGERLGAVPAAAPTVPLQRDLEAEQRAVRLKPAALVRDLDLDLRKDNDLRRSRLLHRLRLLGVGWGEPGELRRGKGTFRESWKLAWRPEFAVDLIEAGAYGTTVHAATATKVRELANAGAADRTGPGGGAGQGAGTLVGLTDLVERCLLADLPDVLPDVLRVLADRVAADTDVTHLLAAIPALARTLRYGDVRGTDTAALRDVATGLLVRACIGLPAAVAALDDSAATTMVTRIDATHAALSLLAPATAEPGRGEVGEEDLRERWLGTLAGIAGRDDLHGLLAGRLTRLLYDAGRLDADETARRMGLVLTVGVPADRAATWVEGFLSGGGLLLVHDEALLGLVDRWLAAIPADAFVEVLPLLRRAFGRFAAPERRAIGEQVRRSGQPGQPGSAGPVEEIDEERAALPIRTVARLLGIDLTSEGVPS
jgi:hypothetical protein